MVMGQGMRPGGNTFDGDPPADFAGQFAPQLAADDRPLSGVHQPVRSLHDEDLGNVLNPLAIFFRPRLVEIGIGQLVERLEGRRALLLEDVHVDRFGMKVARRIELRPLRRVFLSKAGRKRGHRAGAGQFHHLAF